MASELTIGLNTTHTWDLGANEASGQTILTMDAFTAANLHGETYPWGWRGRTGTPGTPATYVPGTKFKFTDGDSTIYELVSAKAADNTFTCTREGLSVHTGINGARKNQEISTIATVADSSGSLNNKYFNIQNEAGTKYHVWIDVNSAGSDPAPTGSTGIEVDVATGANAATVATAVKNAIDGTSGFGATVSDDDVTVTDDATGDVVDITAGNSGFTVAVSEQGSTVEMLVRPTCGDALGMGTGGGGDRRRLRNLGYI